MMAEVTWYQIVAFVDREPEAGHAVYSGPAGWLPQVAIRRRYASENEARMLDSIGKLAAATKPFKLAFGQVVAGRLPVDVIEVGQSQELMDFHGRLFRKLGRAKFAEREGAAYYPHMTISWRGKQVVAPAEFVGSTHIVNAIWVLKDNESDSVAMGRFSLGQAVL